MRPLLMEDKDSFSGIERLFYLNLVIHILHLVIGQILMWPSHGVSTKNLGY